MQGKTRPELYRVFIECVGEDVQRERKLVNRRMLSVFLWCFLIPAGVTLGSLILIKAHVFPRALRNHLDWIILVFPVLYSLYILGSEVLVEVPAVFRRGGIVSALGQPVRESEWRERVCELLARNVGATLEDWDWIIASFRMDLQAMRYRNGYLTALAGAVFFLLMHGIDAITEPEKVTWVKTAILGWVETSAGNMSQFVGLALFLVLLYLSGNQTYYMLSRYLNCAELIKRGSGTRRPS